MYEDTTPIDPRSAFDVTVRNDSESTQEPAEVQAAVLLASRLGVMGPSKEVIHECEQSYSADGFEMPELRALTQSRRQRHSDVVKEMVASPKELEQEPSDDRVQEAISRHARKVYDQPTPENASALFESALHSRHELVKVAAAAGARESTRARGQTMAILEAGADSEDRLVQDVALVTLAQIDPHHETVLRHQANTGTSTPRNRQSNTAVISHGTFASRGTWWRPGGDFYEALNQARPDLDLHDTSFQWSGGYSRSARSDGAIKLEKFLADEGIGAPDWFSHSHGGTVAHLATTRGVQFDRLVHMAVPVHEQWFPDPNGFVSLVDIRVKWDLVILADRGGQRFRNTPFDAKITEHRHGWFDHSAPHEPAYWDRHGLWGVV